MTQAGRKHVEPEDLEHRALTLRAVGWQLLMFDAVIVVFVFVGFRTGSLLWLDWTVMEGIIGLGLIAIGTYWESVAGHKFGERAHTVIEAEPPMQREG